MRIIVVGGGITGVSSALCLARDNHDVTLIDRIMPGDEDQTSFGNAGILASAAVIPVSVPGLLSKVPKMWLDRDGPLFFNPIHLPGLLPWLLPFLRQATPEGVRKIAAGLTPLISDSVEQHEALAKGTDAARYIQRGPYVYLYPSRADFEAESLSWEIRKEHGFTWDEWDRDLLVDRDPHLGPDHNFGIALHNHGWVTHPSAYCKALSEAFLSAGGTFERGDVVDLQPLEDGQAKVTLAGGKEITAERVIMTTGVWSGQLAERVGHKAMIQAERGYHVVFVGANHRPPTPYMISNAKCAATPMEPGMRIAGLAEFAPIDAPAKQTPYALIRRNARRLYPDLEWESETSWMGRRPSTPDSLPLLGQSPKAPGVIFACGGQHLGLTMGPKVGRIAAGLATQRPANLDTTPYRVERFDA
ncbi:MAG: FAD-binding oxidoreductase [Pseudomonadota bacterium]